MALPVFKPRQLTARTILTTPEMEGLHRTTRIFVEQLRDYWLYHPKRKNWHLQRNDLFYWDGDFQILPTCVRAQIFAYDSMTDVYAELFEVTPKAAWVAIPINTLAGVEWLKPPFYGSDGYGYGWDTGMRCEESVLVRIFL